ncbi:hypothetical protein [Streptomyces sp. SID11385]|uniref:hypothetical protein n=1 Tax=Streptomyces sp. SID11385 TaxID=2706031 RepID=UPI0013C9FD9D|nr:hypothetical protein [Streptomyces sp. SID11385]NEA44522.1 hypothetical protein [Streptomyces sp. SID11385]
MNNDIQKAAERVAKLRAQADKLSAPLDDALAQLEKAERAEEDRRALRAENYDTRVAATYKDRLQEMTESAHAARERFFEALSGEPWFAGYVEYRSARHKREYILSEARAAQRNLGQVCTVPDQRWTDNRFADDLLEHLEKKAYESADKFGEEMRTARRDFISAE